MENVQLLRWMGVNQKRVRTEPPSKVDQGQASSEVEVRSEPMDQSAKDGTREEGSSDGERRSGTDQGGKKGEPVDEEGGDAGHGIGAVNRRSS